MKQVLDAFRSLIKDGDTPIQASEFTQFWTSCTPDLKETLKVNAAAMGFTA